MHQSVWRESYDMCHRKRHIHKHNVENGPRRHPLRIWFWHNGTQSHLSIDPSRKSSNALDKQSTCAHFCCKIVHYGIWDRCIVDLCKMPLYVIPLNLDLTRPGSTWWHKQHNNDDVIKWKLFPRYWPFVWGIHRSPVNSPHKGQWRRAFMFSLILAWTNGWANNRDAGDLRRHRRNYDVTVMNASAVWKTAQISNSTITPDTCSSSMRYGTFVERIL